jgi:predicted dehydrogenase
MSIIEKDLKIACIGAGNYGTSHIIWFEQRIPGSIVAFCDLIGEEAEDAKEL